MSNFASNEIRRLAAVYRERAETDEADRETWLQIAESTEAQALRIDEDAADTPAKTKAKELGLASRSRRHRF